MPYFTDAFSAYLLLSQFSKASRKELMNNFTPFKNSMNEFRREISFKDEGPNNLIFHQLEKAKKSPLMLLKIKFYVNVPRGLEDIREFEDWFEGVSEIGPDPYTEDFMPVDNFFLTTSFKYSRVDIHFNALREAVRDKFSIFKGNPKFINYTHIKWINFAP
jgi:hypothetical protein